MTLLSLRLAQWSAALALSAALAPTSLSDAGRFDVEYAKRGKGKFKHIHQDISTVGKEVRVEGYRAEVCRTLAGLSN